MSELVTPVFAPKRAPDVQRDAPKRAEDVPAPRVFPVPEGAVKREKRRVPVFISVDGEPYYD